MKITILHLIERLNNNGKTILLKNIITNMPDNTEHYIITLKSHGPMALEFSNMGIHIHPLFLPDYKRALILFYNFIKSDIFNRIDVMICWSGVSNILSTFLRLFNIPVIWTIHNDYVIWKNPYEKVGVIISSFLSNFIPYKIVCCGEKVYHVYKNIHKFNHKKLEVISNGINSFNFSRNEEDRVKVRKELNLKDDKIVFVSALRMEVNRDDLRGDKDVESLLQAIKIACDNDKRDHNIYVLFGSNISWENEVLKERIRELCIEKNIILMGYQKDVVKIFSGADIYLSASKMEGLSLTLLEAMACGLIPICTNAGDTEKVIGSSGWVVNIGDINLLSKYISYVSTLNKEEREKKALAAIQTVKDNYEIRNVAEKYITLAKNAKLQFKRYRRLCLRK